MNERASEELKLFYIIEKMFDSYMNTDDYNRNDIQIGHTYFLRKSNGNIAKEQMKNRFLYQVIPVVREYINDGILLEDIYGEEPDIYEKDCLDLIREMATVTDMGTLDSLYDTLLNKLDSPEITQRIKDRLLEKKIFVE